MNGEFGNPIDPSRKMGAQTSNDQYQKTLSNLELLRQKLQKILIVVVFNYELPL